VSSNAERQERERNRQTVQERKDELYRAAADALEGLFVQEAPGVWLIFFDSDRDWPEAGSGFVEHRRALIEHVLRERTRWTTGELRENLHNLFYKCGLPIPEKLAPPLIMERQVAKTVEERWERILGWMETLSVDLPTLEQVSGNIDNLQNLITSGDLLDDELRAQMGDAQARLKDLRTVLESDAWDEDNFDFVAYLVHEETMTSDDWQTALDQAGRATLAYTLALISGVEGQGLRAGKIRAWLNALSPGVEMKQ